MRRLICALFMLASINAVAAEQDDELQRLHNALNLLDQEQLAIYQQFQMVQALQRSHFALPYGTSLVPVPGGELANYDDVIAAQERIARRSEELAEQASQLVTRYGEIEEEKRPLRQQILRLMNPGD